MNKLTPAGTWNSIVIWANGNDIETWLNGMKVTDFVIGSKEYSDRYGRSKFSPGCGDFGRKNATGKLVVQDHGGGFYVWMRNNKIRPLNAAAALPKPLITPDGGTFGGTTKVTLDAGMTAYIRYTLDGADPTESSPLYNDSAGLAINKAGATTLKAKTFRPGFTASALSSAAFTLSGSSLLPDGMSGHPDVDFSHAGRRLSIRNGNGRPFTVDLIPVHGRKGRTLGIDRTVNGFDLSDLPSGVCLVEMHAGTWQQTRKIMIP